MFQPRPSPHIWIYVGPRVAAAAAGEVAACRADVHDIHGCLAAPQGRPGIVSVLHWMFNTHKYMNKINLRIWRTVCLLARVRGTREKKRRQRAVASD